MSDGVGSRFPSMTTILSILFLLYMGNSMWTLVGLYIPPNCSSSPSPSPSSVECLKSSLTDRKELTLLFFISDGNRPNVEKDLKYLNHLQLPDPHRRDLPKMSLRVPLSRNVALRNVSSLYFAVFSIPLTKEKMSEKNVYNLIAKKDATYNIVPLTQYRTPEPETFNLMDGNEQKPDREESKPVVHIRSSFKVSIMTDDVEMPVNEIPGELYYLLRRGSNSRYLPVVYIDELSLRLRDLVIVNATDTEAAVDIEYQPISYGKLRLFLQFTASLSSMHGLGFTSKDTDEVKGIFADTNIALLIVTFSVSAIHLLFDFLAFKNDISFWRSKQSMVGLSRTTVMWRAFSQTVIFLYLMDENTSLLVLIPSGISALIEIWKVTKAISVSKAHNDDKDEKSTKQFDNDAMKYLSYILYPLVIGGAGYSLIYTPHKSWWSWTIQSTVNGVYAFGFLFMLPQLFVNYKLKSVAHLPWRAFMYKAFNTFIDDLFAFIITMPTAHRVACFRDDIVFLIYLYQRYLYPVDSSRIDMSTMMDEDQVSHNKEAKKEK